MCHSVLLQLQLCVSNAINRCKLILQIIVFRLEIIVFDFQCDELLLEILTLIVQMLNLFSLLFQQRFTVCSSLLRVIIAHSVFIDLHLQFL